MYIYILTLDATSSSAAIFAVPATSKYKMWFLQPMKLSSLLRLLPLSVLAIASKLLTYWSYSRVPVAVTHTCKASTPLFNVMLAFVVYRTSHATPIYVSLVPIVVGVAMASLSEVQINLHFYSGLLCILVNSPVLMWNQAMLPDQYESAMFFIYSHEIRNVIFLPRIPYTLIFVCSICQFVSSLASILLLGHVAELTYSIMSTLKRVVIVVSAVVYFGNAMTLTSGVGMAVALGGVGMYQHAKLTQTKAVGHSPHSL
ncbi:hypothetical protein B5M09_005380 [Aphanomyces astaci]|uniref:Sugar phosphate transporter domain-containing protein n=1 Tax=Aphanomyces astaci TaxID=112090 RepID=A0A425BZZ7_APHAT|nr:hypothetical protein B5M09_005380 [Aphanomyces astaci]